MKVTVFSKMIPNITTLKVNLRNMIVFGLLAAFFANIKFTVPGLESATSDAREIFALISTVFLGHWVYALGVGLIASFGSYNSLTVTILMHITAIPIAWLFLNLIRKKISNIVLLSLLWGFMVLGLSLIVYPGVYTISNFILGNIEITKILDTYILFITGTTFEIVINPLITSMAIFSIFIFRDVQEKSTYLRLIEENTKLGLWDWDINNDKITYNEQWAKMLGYTLDEINSKQDSWRGLVHENDYENTLKILDENLKGESDIYSTEYRMRSKSGEYIWIHDRGNVLSRNDNGKATRMVGIHLDITKQKELSSKIEHLQYYLSNIINSMPSILIGVDTNGNITQWNSEAEMSTGVPINEAVGKPLLQVIPHLSKEMDKINKAIAEGHKEVETKRTRYKDGQMIYEDITIFPLIEKDVEGAVIRIDNITERVILEEIMIQSEKMISIGGLAAGMAHEINNPLAGMMQNANVLLNRLTSKTPKNIEIANKLDVDLSKIFQFFEERNVIKMLELINDSGVRASNIVTNMLSFARKSESTFKEVNIVTAIDDTIKLVENDYDMKKKYDFKKIEIIKNYNQDLPVLWGDESKIKQVIMNVLKNGAEAMSEKAVDNDTLETLKNPKFIITITSDLKFLNIGIKDNGPGIPENVKKRVFEPFYTTKDIGKGTGLGLSISYFIITENHKGRMWVESEEGKGTEFKICLPLTNRDCNQMNKIP